MFRMNGIARWHGCQGAHMFRMNGMARCQGQFFALGNYSMYCPNQYIRVPAAKTAFLPSMAVMAKSVYVQDKHYPVGACLHAKAS
jgi:hypothetical protein